MSIENVGINRKSRSRRNNTVGAVDDSSLVLDIYGRVSRLMDNRMRSVEGQVTDCRVRVEEYGASVGEVLTDPGRSAWNPKVKRPAWDTLMERLVSGASHGVCVFELARFSRQPIEGERLIQVAQRGLVVLDSENEFDLTTPDGKAAFRDQMKMAAYYSDRLSTVSRRGKRIKAMQGELIGSHRSFGFEPDGVTLRMTEVEIMREAARRLLGLDDEPRWTLDEVALDLNSRGILTTAGPCSTHDGTEARVCTWCGRKNANMRGDGTWTGNTFRIMLLKQCNAGYVEYKGNVVGRLLGEPIFDEEIWAELNAFFAARRRGRPLSETYLCSGIAVCGRCRHHLTGSPKAGTNPYPDGEPRRKYWCQPRSTGSLTGGCGRISVDQRALDKHVKSLVVTILSSPKHAAQVEAAANARKKLDDERSKLQTKIADLDHMANVLAERLGREEMSLERYDAAAGPLEKRLTTLRTQLEELDDQLQSTPKVSAQEVKASREAWDKRWEAATTSERRHLLRLALNGRALVVGPLDIHAPRVFDPDRVTIEPARRKKK